jgi:glycosyltransferase involved in cell wall biosynthesis
VSASVVVPTRDRPQALAGCLAALARQDLGGLELIVVDDGSQDRGALERAVGGGDRVRVIRTPGRGPAAARNLGARAASEEVVLFTDDDCEPKPGWARLLVAAATGASDGIAAGRTAAPAGSSSAVRASQAITNHLLLDALTPGGTTTFAPTCNLAVSREVLAHLPFDDSYPTAAGEDRDWCARAVAAGHAIAYQPEAIVIHRQRLNTWEFVRQQYRYGRGAARFRRGEGGRRGLSGAGFYARLVRRGFGEGAGAGGLVLAAQVATAGGVARERLSGRSRHG